MEDIIDQLVRLIGTLGYGGIIILMFLESSMFPFPSEVVMIPAGYLAYLGEMNIILVFLCGLLGSIGGALFNYYLAATLGREILARYGRYVLISPDKLDKMDAFFAKHGEISTFNGRLIPGVRQYISLPAGIARMSVIKFVIYTALGAGIWMIVLIALGYYLGANRETADHYLTYFTIGAIVLVIIITAFYVKRHRQKKKQLSLQTSQPPSDMPSG